MPHEIRYMTAKNLGGAFAMPREMGLGKKIVGILISQPDQQFPFSESNRRVLFMNALSLPHIDLSTNNHFIATQQSLHLIAVSCSQILGDVFGYLIAYIGLFSTDNFLWAVWPCNQLNYGEPTSHIYGLSSSPCVQYI